jgi:hypothetical protein
MESISELQLTGSILVEHWQKVATGNVSPITGKQRFMGHRPNNGFVSFVQ